MLCPYCQTENRDDRENCYYCNKDLSMLRLIVNKAKHHYNQGLEHAERGRFEDAVTEMKNALELDGTMVNAHVVLGTLYMKKEMFKEAREAWNQALAMDHRYEKAHQYLEKSERAEQVFPAINRLKYLSLGLAALLLVFVVYALALQRTRRDPEMAHVREALQMASENPPRIDPAVEMLDQVLAEKDLQTRTRNFAQAARNVIAARDEVSRRTAQQFKDQAVADVTAALNQNAPWVAWQIIEAHERRGENPADPRLQELRKATIQSLAHRLEHEADAVRAGKQDLREFQEEAGRFLALFPAGTEHDQVAALLNQVKKGRHERVLAETGSLAAATDPITTVIPKLAALREQAPELAKEINAHMARRLADQIARFSEQLDPLIEQGREAEAIKQAETLIALSKSAGVEPPKGLLEQIAAKTGERDRARALAEANAAFAAKDWNRFVELTADPAKLTPDPAEQEKLTAMRTQALQNAAVARWTWFEQRDDKFESLRLSNDEATTAVQIFEATLANLPKSRSDAKGPILFYAAAAHLKLGQPAQARDLLDRLEREYPKSYVVKPAKKFKQKYAKQLQG